MYAGDLDECTPNRLLLECLCVVKDQAAQGLVNTVEINLHDGAVSIHDDGPGWDLSHAEAHLTQLFACKAAKGDGTSLCKLGIVVPASLAFVFTFVTFDKGRQLWSMDFAQGEPASNLKRESPDRFTEFVGKLDFSKGRGTHMYMVLDRRILPWVVFDAKALVQEAKLVCHVDIKDNQGCL